MVILCFIVKCFNSDNIKWCGVFFFIKYIFFNMLFKLIYRIFFFLGCIILGTVIYFFCILICCFFKTFIVLFLGFGFLYVFFNVVVG